jgi:ABC-type sugar transport system ATPase subunit
MKILMGIYSADGGRSLDGQPVAIHNPHRAIAHGISMIHQELNPVPIWRCPKISSLGREIVRRSGQPGSGRPA